MLTFYMKKLFVVMFLALSCYGYAIDIDLLKQSLVGTWHPVMHYDNDNPNDENKLEFYLDGNKLMVRYVADYSWVWGDNDNKSFNEYGTCPVKINYDGTLEFNITRKETGYDRKGNEERKGYGEYSYNLFFVDGRLVGTEKWGRRYLKMQPTNDRDLVRFRTIEQAERRGNVSAFPFGNSTYTSQVNFYNSNKSNIKKFYNNGVISELSNCNPDDYKYGFLLGKWDYYDNGRWIYGSQAFEMEIFVRDNGYYLKYYYDLSEWTYGVVQIYPDDSCGDLSLSFATKQRFWGKCEGYNSPWNYDMMFYVEKDNNERFSGSREWTNVNGPLNVCGIPEPEKCNIVYLKRK